MAKLVHGEKDTYIHELISMIICVLEKIFKGKHFGVKKKPFSCCLTQNFGRMPMKIV